MDEERSGVGLRIESLRALVCMTSRELDRVSGLGANHSRAIEVGTSRPTAATLERIAATFGVSIDWLWTGRGVRPSNRKIHAAAQRARTEQEKRTGT